MTRMLRPAMLAVAVFACQFASAQADPILYTFVGTGSGTLDGHAFTSFTITALGDTSTVSTAYPPSTFVSPNLVTITAGGYTDTLSSHIIAAGNSGTGTGDIALFDQTLNKQIVGGHNVALASYNMVTYQATTSLTPDASSYTGATAGGTLVLSITAASSLTFAAVPEPASLAMFGTGLVGVLFLARRRLTKATIDA